MAVSKTLRFQVFRRDGHRCHYCGATPPDVKLTIDHVTAVALGGTDIADNLVTACEDCNSGKSAIPADAPTIAAIQEREQQFRDAITAIGEDDRAREEFTNAFLDAWDTAGGTELQLGWKKTIDAYRRGGLPPHAWPEIVSITFAKADLDDPFRYCCGIARNRVAQIQERAKAVAGRSDGERADSAKQPSLDVVAQAVVSVWETGWTEEFEAPPDADLLAEFSNSMLELRRAEEAAGHAMDSPHRLMKAASYGGAYQLTTIGKCLEWMTSQERSDIVMSWADAWRAVCGAWPDGSRYNAVSKRCDALRDAGAPAGRMEFAATMAGFHTSETPHWGIQDNFLTKAGIIQCRETAIDMWARAFAFTSMSWPSSEQRDAFGASLDRIIAAGSHLQRDLFIAAVAAGVYEATDLTGCLPLNLSVFDAAAALPNPSEGA